MSLSADAIKRLMIATTSATAGNELATAVNNAIATSALSVLGIPAAIVATNVSTTIDFGSLLVGDKVLVVPTTISLAVAHFLAVVTAGTLPAAAVVGDLYVVIRPVTLPAASAATF